MDRPLIMGAAAYLGGLVLGTAFSYFPVLVSFIVATGIGLSIDLVRTQGLSKNRRVTGWALALFGAVNLQMTMTSHTMDDLLRLATRERVVVYGQIDAPLQHRAGGPDEPESTILFMDTEAVVIEGKKQRVDGRLRLTVRGFIPEVQYGDQIGVETPLRPPTGFLNPGGFDYASYLERQGIGALGTIHRPEDLVRIGVGGNPIFRKIYDWREQIRSAMVRSLSPEASAILQATIIGESGFLTPKIREAFMASGTTHILSISGSHLSLVALVVFTGIWWMIRHLPVGLLLRLGRAMKPTQVGAMMTIPPVIFYALLAGGQIATIRSLIMILIYLGSVGLMRDHDPLHALAAAALSVTLWNPLAIFDISFQLSYGAVLAMALTVRGGVGAPLTFEATRLGSFFQKAKMAFLLTVVATVSTAPLVAFHFNQFSWVGLFSNLIVIPLVGMLVVPLGLICAIAVIGSASPVFPLAGLVNGLVAVLMAITETFARLPWAELHSPSPPIGVIALWYAAAGIAFLSRISCLKRTGIAALCLILTLPWIPGIIRQEGLLRLTFLDVGQGDAALIQFPEGQTMLVDGGGRYGDFDAGRLAVAPYLWDRSVRRIDYLVATHPQADHAGGLIYILRKFPVGEIWTNGVTKEALFFADFIRAAGERGLSTKTIGRQEPPLEIGGTTVSILHPGSVSSHVQDNNRSLVIRIQYGKYSFLFTGDIEAQAERELLRWGPTLSSTVLKVPHHGSRSSIEPEFLLHVCPRMAIISSGASNPYGQPAPETLAAYRLLGSQVYRTDREGAIVVTTDGQRLTVATYRDFALTPICWGRGMLREEWGNGRKIVRRWSAS